MAKRKTYDFVGPGLFDEQERQIRRQRTLRPPIWVAFYCFRRVTGQGSTWLRLAQASYNLVSR